MGAWWVGEIDWCGMSYTVGVFGWLFGEFDRVQGEFGCHLILINFMYAMT